jgi:hypothetical protein
MSLVRGTSKGKAFTAERRGTRGRKSTHLEMQILNAKKEDHFYEVSKEGRKDN